jgi:hypothetical protein
VKDALVDSAIPEKCKGNPVISLHLGSQSYPSGVRDTSSYDGVGNQQAVLVIREVHGATLSLATTSGFAKHLSHGEAGAQTLSQRMTVATVGTAHGILAAQRPAASNRRGFLTNARMERTAYFPLKVKIADSLFEFADDEHLPVGIRQSFWFDRHLLSP